MPSAYIWSHIRKAKQDLLRVLSIHHREEAPCRSFKRYKGVRAPSCACRPCLEKYLENQKAAGKAVAVLEEDPEVSDRKPE
jgi:hypothetical protein